MNTPYTAAVVGGGMGGGLSLAALAASPLFELRAVADLHADVRTTLAERYPGIRTFATHTEMFAACPTDVVCVSTYAPTHLPITLDALALPLKGIVVEKPLGDTVAAGREIIDAVRARNLPMAVPHGLLVMRHAQEIIARVQQGEIGELTLVEIECDKWDIINAGIHWFNFFVVLTGNTPLDYILATCDTSTRTYRDGMQVETLAVAYAQTQSGVRVVMQTGDYVKTMRDGKSILFRLIGTAGTIEFYAWESCYRLLNAQHPHGELIEVERDPRSAHQIHLEHLAAQITNGAPDYAVAESSLAALALCEGAYLSNQHRCAVRFPFEQFVPPAPNDWEPGQPYSGAGGGRDGRKLT